ncbi:MAG: phosphoglycerate kinase [Candidatus Njordarchaeia archaeon]
MEDFEIDGKKVLVRIDINSPIDLEKNDILDDSRLRAHSATIRELVDKYNASVVLIAHQGRPGTSDFVSLDIHAKVLSNILKKEVDFIDDVIGPAAREKIKQITNGEILLLDNVRLLAEENINASPEKQAKTFLVRKLAPLFDYFILDAFGTAHRSQPSLVGFPMVLPSAAGLIMEREVKALSRIVSQAESPKIFVLGGAKVDDSIRIIETLTKNKVADRILLTGLLSEIFLLAKGIKLGEENMKIIAERGLIDLIREARRILLRGAPIDTPVDFVTLDGEEMKTCSATEIKGIIRDIGPQTVESYSELLKESKIIVMRGPAGVMEDSRFRKGTEELVKNALKTEAYIIFGGGHLSAIASNFEHHPSKVHVSTGGGALLTFLSGVPLPALEALSKSGEKFLWNKSK